MGGFLTEGLLHQEHMDVFPTTGQLISRMGVGVGEGYDRTRSRSIRSSARLTFPLMTLQVEFAK